MSYFLTIISSDLVVSQLILEQVFDFLRIQSIDFEQEYYVLSQGHAVDISIKQPLNKDQIDALRDALPQMDVLLSSADSRKKKLFLADMDSTIVAAETLDELAAYANVGDQVSSITEQSMRGEINFEESLTRRVALLEGMSEHHMQAVLNTMKLNSGAGEALKIMSKNDTRTALISGGFTFYTEAIANKLGFDDHHGNVLEIKDGKLTGRLAAPILGPDAKLKIMEDKMSEHDIKTNEVLAVGDGANDLFMLEAAGLGGVAYYPKPILQERIINQIRYSDLTSLLYMQGYRDNEITDLKDILS